MNPWLRLCRCGHPMRDHRLDWDDPMDGSTPDCRGTLEVFQPEGPPDWVPCECMEFTVMRAIQV